MLSMSDRLIRHNFRKTTDPEKARKRMEAIECAQVILKSALMTMDKAGITSAYDPYADIEATIKDMEVDIKRARVCLELDGPNA